METITILKALLPLTVEVLNMVCRNDTVIPVNEPLPAVYPPLKRLHVTSGFGHRTHPFTRRHSFHAGVDLAAKNDTVYAIMDASVTDVGYDRHLGRYIRLGHGPITVTYGHLSAIAINIGEQVLRGQPMAITGSTGRTTGEHLHFTLTYSNTALDPMKLFARLFKSEGEMGQSPCRGP